ncbi:MAG: proton-conducting transporter membrane subunit [Methanophagales archaeon]|nr:proton-conducting transporter membrane subunit [Methanophagales archaeon]
MSLSAYALIASRGVIALKASFTYLVMGSIGACFFLLFLVGLSIKMALFPLHTCLPDAHSFAPSEISAMLSGIIIEVSTYALIRVCFSVFHAEFPHPVAHIRYSLLDSRIRQNHRLYSRDSAV